MPDSNHGEAVRQDELERYEGDRHFVRGLLSELQDKLVPIQRALGEWGLQSVSQFADLLALFDQEDANGLRLVVFGAFSSGKSALVNALLGQRLLTTGNLATTAVITEMRYGAANKAKPLLVTYKNRGEIVQDIQDLLQEEWEVLSAREDRPPEQDSALERLLGLFKDGSALTRTNLDSLIEYLRAHGQTPPGMEPRELTRWNNRRQYLQHIAEHGRGPLLRRLGKSARAPLSDLSRVTGDERETFAVRSVQIPAPMGFLRGNVIIVDTPGLGSIYERHTETTEGFVRSADVVLYVMTDRGVGEHDIAFIGMLAKRNQILNEDKVIYAVNMIDHVVREGETQAEIEAEIAAHLAQIRQDLQQHGIRQPRLYGVSAECALYSLAALEGEPFSNKDKRLFRKMAIYFPESADLPDPAVNLELSGIQTLRGALRTYLIENTGRLLRERTCSRIRAALTSVYEEIGAREASMSLTEKQLLQDIEDWGQEKDEIRRMERASLHELSDTLQKAGYARITALVDELLQSLVRQLPENLYLATRKRRLFQSLRDSLERPAFAVRDRLAAALDKSAAHTETGLEARFTRTAKRAIREVTEQLSFKERYEAIIQELKASVEHLSWQRLTAIDERIRCCKGESNVGLVMKVQGLAEETSYRRLPAMHQDIDLSLALKGSAFSGSLIGVGGAAGFVVTIPIDPVISPIVGIISMLIVGAIVEFSKDEDEVKAQVRKQVERAIEEKRPGMLASALSPLREYEEQVAREFSAKVGQRAGGFDDILEDARDALRTTRADNEAMRVHLEKARTILLDAGGRCKTRLLPETSDSIA